MPSPGPKGVTEMPPARSDAPAADALPGYYIRRLQQIAVAIFLQETQAHGITPVQYAALYAALRQPGLDQRTLASCQPTPQAS